MIEHASYCNQSTRDERSSLVITGEPMNKPLFEIYFSYDFDDSVWPPRFEEEAFTLLIECATGDVYELRIWTEAYLNRTLAQNREIGVGLNSQFLIPPDLVLANRDIETIELIVADLIHTKRL